VIHISDIRILLEAGYTRADAVKYAVLADNGDKNALDIILAAHALRLALLKRMGKLFRREQS